MERCESWRHVQSSKTCRSLSFHPLSPNPNSNPNLNPNPFAFFNVGTRWMLYDQQHVFENVASRDFRRNRKPHEERLLSSAQVFTENFRKEYQASLLELDDYRPSTADLAIYWQENASCRVCVLCVIIIIAAQNYVCFWYPVVPFVTVACHLIYIEFLHHHCHRCDWWMTSFVLNFLPLPVKRKLNPE